MNIKSSYFSFTLVAAVLALASLGAWGFLIYQSAGLKAKLASISASAESAAAKEARSLGIKAALRDSRESVAAVDARFVAKDGIPEFIDGLEAKARAAGVKADVSSINLDESGDPAALKSLRLHIAGQGDWKSIVSYVASLEALPFASKVEGVSISKANGSWGFSLDLSALASLTSQTQ